MSQIYFFSDPHAFHKNLCKGSTVWPTTPDEHGVSPVRDFKDQYAMTAAILTGINKKVNEGDILYCLGDWSFGNLANVYNFRKQIACKTVHLIYGNHDKDIRQNRVTPQLGIPCQELFTSVQDVLDLKINGHKFFLSHYAHRSWPKMHRGCIHLYGHSHASLEYAPYGLSMDVGLDAYYYKHGRYEPFSLTEVLAIMDKRQALYVDHHKK